MKFSEISQEDWASLQPYMDTCLLPITGLKGTEAPWEATEVLEQLRDALELVEIPFKGRVVTYPAIHYSELEAQHELINSVCVKLKEAGFKHVVVMTTRNYIGEGQLSDADLILCIKPEELVESLAETKRNVSELLQTLWKKVK